MASTTKSCSDGAACVFIQLGNLTDYFINGAKQVSGCSFHCAARL